MTKSTKHILQFCAVFTMFTCSAVPALVAAWLICPWFWPEPVHAAQLFNDDGVIIGASHEASQPAKTGGWTHAEKMLECDKLPTWMGVLACRFDQ